MPLELRSHLQRFFRPYLWWCLICKIYKKALQKIYGVFPKSLMGRSLIIIITPIILLQIILTIYFYDKHWKDISVKLSDYLAGEITFLIDTKKTYDPEKWEILKQNIESRMALTITFRKDEILTPLSSSKGHSQIERIFKSRLRPRVPYDFTIDAWTYSKKIEIKIQLNDGVLRILTSRNRLFSKTTYIFIIWMIGSSIVLTAISILFMRNQIKPIRKLALAAERFGKGKNAPHHKPSGASEIRQATQAFNSMQERIVKQINQRTEMLAGVSHDLRTPLTRMSLLVAMIEKSTSKTDETDDLKINIREMEKMIEGYLAFAKGANTEHAESINITEILNNIVKKCARKRVQIILNAEQNLYRALKPVAFQRCMLNLVDNACKYGKTVMIKAYKEDERLKIQIDDDGPGIPASKRKLVFKPFYRIDSARRSHTGGIGLGLAIVKDIIRSHGGEIDLSESDMGGLRVNIFLPL